MNIATRKSFSIVLIFALVLIVCLSLGLGLSNSADALGAPIQQAKLRVGQISDVHYFPFEHSYHNFDHEDFELSDFYGAMAGDTKLIFESGMILNATVKNILDDGDNGIAPDILIVSGDLCKNGEHSALIDVANSMRYLQNEMRTKSGYQNFQVFVLPGNHDLYNNSGELYTNPSDLSILSKGYMSEAVTSANFALIFAGLGYPNASLDGDADSIRLLDFYPADYWSSSFTSGYQESSLTLNFSVDYYSDAIDNAMADAQDSDPDTVPYADLDATDLNGLTYAVKFENYGGINHSGYTLLAFDSSDRHATDELVPVRLSCQDFESVALSGQRVYHYADCADGTKEFVPYESTSEMTAIEVAKADMDAGKAVYISAGQSHVTGGRLGDDVLAWAENLLGTAIGTDSTDGIAEETVIASLHHNVIPHFTEEGNILKDFTVYNFEYIQQRFMDMGIRYVFTGHMHTSDIASTTSLDGDILYDFETGSSVSYDSPRRYVDFERYDNNGSLAEKSNSEVHVLEHLNAYASDDIFDTPDFDMSLFNPVSKDDPDHHAKLEVEIAKQPAYQAFIMRYDELSTKTFNQYISDNLYSQLIDRMINNFVGPSLIDTIHGALDSLLDSDNAIVALLDQYVPIISKIADELIGKLVGGQNIENLTGDTVYCYNNAEYDDIFDYIKGIIANTVGFTSDQGMLYGDSNLGKIGAGNAIVNVYLAHIMGKELLFDLDIDDAEMQSYLDSEFYVPNSASDPEYRERLISATNEILEDAKSGQFAEDLFSALLEPLFYDDNSLIKSLLSYRFDFSDSSVGLTMSEKANLNKLFDILSGLLGALGVDKDFEIKADDFCLGDILSALLESDMVAGLLSDMLGFAPNAGDDIITTVENLLDTILTDQFYVGIGNTAYTVLYSMGFDETADYATIADTSLPYLVDHFDSEFSVSSDTFTYVSGRTLDIAPTTENGLAPSHLALTFGDDSTSTEAQISYFTNENVFSEFKWREKGTNNWNTLSTSGYSNSNEVFTQKTEDYLSSIDTDTDSKSTMTTSAYPISTGGINLCLASIMQSSATIEVLDGDETVAVRATSRDRNNAMSNSIKFVNHHHIQLAGLDQDTEYEYEITTYTIKHQQDYALSDITGQGFNSFKTAKSYGEEFEFVSFGNMGDMSKSQYQVGADAIDALIDSETVGDFDFVASPGDFTSLANNYDQFGYAMNLNSDLFAEKQLLASSSKNNSLALAGDKTYSCHEYMNTSFVVLDSTLFDNDQLEKDQIAWLKKTLSKTESENIVVLMNKALYSYGTETSEIKRLQKLLVPIFNSYGVDLVLSADNYAYTSSHLIGNNLQTRTALKNSTGIFSDGVMFVNVGSMSTASQMTFAENTKINADLSIGESINSQTLTKVSILGDDLIVKCFVYDQDSSDFELMSTVKLSGDNSIALSKLKEIAKQEPDKLYVGLFDSKLDKAIMDNSILPYIVPYAYELSYLYNDKSYASLDEIEIKGFKSEIAIQVTYLDGDTTKVETIKTMYVEKSNYLLIIILPIIAGLLVIAGVVLAVLITKKKHKALIAELDRRDQEKLQK